MNYIDMNQPAKEGTVAKSQELRQEVVSSQPIFGCVWWQEIATVSGKT